MKKLFVSLIVLLSFQGSFSQVELPPAISQYMFNPMSSNPGYAGFYDMMIISNLFRTQIGEGFKTRTNTLNMNTSLPVDKMGAGINLNYDQIGITKSLNFDLSLSYKLQFGANKLSVGVQGSFYRLENAYDLLSYGKLGESDAFMNEFIPDNNAPINSPNFGTGIIYKGRKFFGSFSVPRILTTTEELTSEFENISDGTIVNSSRTARYKPYLTASLGTIIHASNALEVKPSFMLKRVKELGVLLDVNTSVLINKTIWVGASLRNSYQRPDETSISEINLLSSINLMGQLQINEKLKLGASYEFPVNTRTGTSLLLGRSPFEIMASYNIAVFDEQGVHTFLY